MGMCWNYGLAPVLKKGGICMDFLADPVILARIQFAFTAMYHFLLVPVSIGLGLIMAIY